jgi:hypothetical protein
MGGHTDGVISLQNELTYDVVTPRPPLGVQVRQTAVRLDTLAGKRIGFVWDYMFRGEEIFPALERGLRERFPDLEVVGYDVFGNIHGPDEKALVAALPGVMAHHLVDAVIVGNGC